MSLLIIAAGAWAIMNTEPSVSALSSGLNGTEIAVVPTERNRYVTRDIQFALTLPSAFFHQRSETWKPPLKHINFALDTRNNSPTTLSPIEEPEVVVVTLSVVNFDAVDAGYNRSNPNYLPKLETLWERQIEHRYGLNYITNITFPGAPAEEYLFDSGPFYRTEIFCRPSGNTYPSLCTLTQVGDRGGGINPNSKSAVMTEIIFRSDKLPEWKTISNNVESFLKDKITVMHWKK